MTDKNVTPAREAIARTKVLEGDGCAFCGGLHYGSAYCPMQCPDCGKDLRPGGDCLCVRGTVALEQRVMPATDEQAALRDAFETWREKKGYGHGAVFEAWTEAWTQQQQRIDAGAKVIVELRSQLASEELRGVAAELARIRAVVETSDSYVPQDIAAECLLALGVLDEPGKPNTLVALAHRAVDRLDELRAVVGPKLECGLYAVEHTHLVTIAGAVVGVGCPISDHEPTPEYLAWRESRKA